MQANLERLSELERRLSVTLPAADIASEVESRLKRLTRTVKMQGFRPGKVPLKVVAQQYGPQVRQEVLGDAVQKSFGEAVRQQNLRVAGYPRFEAKPLAEGAAEFQYSAMFEVYPEVVVGDISQADDRPSAAARWATRKSTRPRDHAQAARAFRRRPSGAAQNGDRVTIDFRGTLDGAEFQGSTAQGQAVVLGEGRLLQDFEAQLAGMKAGETKILRPALSRRLSGQGSRRQDGAVRSDRQGSGRAAPARRGRRVREEPRRGGRRRREDARGGEGQPGARGQGPPEGPRRRTR